MIERSSVLVVDDSVVIRSVLRKQLEEHGHAVVEAVDGEDALRLVGSASPDIILLDVEMPKLDGYGVLRALRADPATAEIPVVFLTSRATTEDVVEGLRLGAHDYLRKPFEPAELVARVSAALRVKRLQDELRVRNAELDAVSRTDVLTGLPNRRHLEDQLASTASAARRHDSEMALVLIDVDHFKAINDQLGHDAGDLVLRQVAVRIASACRAEDVAGRWGGEEFLVIAPMSDVERAAVLGERIRDRVSAEPIAVESQAITVTVSVGVSSGLDIDGMLRDADSALYAAKAAGRDRVVTA